MSTDEHLSDARLLLLADDDGCGSGAADRRHADGCARCTQRAEELAIGLSGLLASYEDEGATAMHARTRMRLAARLQLAADAPRSGAGWRVIRGVTAGSAAVLLIAVLWLRAPGGPGPDADGTGDDRALPVAALTPGATVPIAAATVCRGGDEAPAIPDAMRRRVLADYGMLNVSPDQYELDYLITPELGGATEARNLWPQRYGARRWNARVKDELETLLPQLVCSGRLDLASAQRDIARDWIAAYKHYFRASEPKRVYGAFERGEGRMLVASAGADPRPFRLRPLPDRLTRVPFPTQ